jgi:hypothetical protein
MRDPIQPTHPEQIRLTSAPERSCTSRRLEVHVGHITVYTVHHYSMLTSSVHPALSTNELCTKKLLRSHYVDHWFSFSKNVAYLGSGQHLCSCYVLATKNRHQRKVPKICDNSAIQLSNMFAFTLPLAQRLCTYCSAMHCLLRILLNFQPGRLLRRPRNALSIWLSLPLNSWTSSKDCTSTLRSCL